MNTQLPLVKRAKNGIVIMLMMVLCLFANFSAIAQSINITINVIPPYSPYYSDYSGVNAGKVFVVLQNLSATQQKIKLVGKLQGDNGVSITTYSNYTPLQPIILNPHEVRQMNGTALKDIFDLNNLSVIGVDKAKLAQTSRIPEGNYNLCLQAVDYNSKAVLSPTAPSGCTYLTIAYPEPPVLVNPSPQAYVYATTPQSIVFSWINPGTVPMGIQYKIEMAQMPDLVNSDPNQVLNAVSFPILSQQVTGLSYLYSIQNLALLPGKKYAWRVTAIDPTGKTVFKNNGVSPASVFTYGVPATADNSALFAVFIPSQQQAFEKVNTDNDFLLDWNYYHDQTATDDTLRVDNTIYQQLGVTQYRVEILSAKPAGGKLTDNAFSYNTIINPQKISTATGSNTVTKVQSAHLFNTVLPASLIRTVTQCDSIGFKDQFWYTANIYALDVNGNVVSKASSVDFQYLHIQDASIQNINVTASLKYQFKGYTDINIAPNSPVEVVALEKSKSTGRSGSSKGLLDNQQYTQLGSATAISDSTGKFTVSVTVPKNVDARNIYYQVNIKNQYYTAPVSNVYRDTINALSPNLGDVLLNVHAYSLKLMVAEAYEYETPVASASTQKGLAKSGYVPQNYGKVVNHYKPGIPVVLYRKNKKSYIPPVEGQLKTTTAITGPSGIEQICSGVTAMETEPDGTQKSYVKFDKLLCNIYNGDEYYILALDSAQYGKDIATGSKALALTPYTDQHFKANELAFTYNNNGQSDLYTNTTGYYSIQSTLPPEATITGQIVYQWAADSTKTRRPLANQHFTVRVASANSPIGDVQMSDGLNGDPVRGVGTTDAQGKFTVKVVVMNVANYGDKLPNDSSYSNPFNSPFKGQNFAPPDGSKFAGSPTTITGVQQSLNNGNPLAGNNNSPGMGGLTGQLGNASIMPGNAQITGMVNEINQAGVQNGMNTDTHAAFTATGDGGFNISLPNLGKSATGGGLQENNFQNIISGPNADAGTETTATEAQTDSLLHSKFYLTFDNGQQSELYFNPQQTIDVDAFTTTDAGTLVSDVIGGARTIKVYDYNTKAPAPGLRILVFTPVNTLPPLGQGDGQGTVGKLFSSQLKNAANGIYKVSDQYNTAQGKMVPTFTHFPGGRDSVVDLSAMFNNTYSIYWNGLTNANGQITVPNLIAANPYMVEAGSDPNQDGGAFYESAIGDAYADSIFVVPLASRIAGRLIDVTNTSLTGTSSQGISGSYITVTSTQPGKSYGKIVGHTYTDGQGYFEILTNDASHFDKTQIDPKNNFSFTMQIQAFGYQQQDTTTLAGTMGLQGQQFNKVIPMMPSGTLKGNVYTADNFSTKGVQGVKSYIQRSDGTVFTTDDKGNFSIPMPGNAQTHVNIIPVDAGYFTETNVVTLEAINRNYPQSYQVHRRQHRFHFVVTDDESNQPVAGAKIYIDAKTILTTTAQGIADINFENVSVSNYSFQVYGASGSGYIPKTLNLTDTESRSPVTFKLQLQRGGIVKGTVTLDGKPVRYAKIYENIKMQAQPPIGVINKDNTGNNDPTLVQAYTDQNGNYTLSGLQIINGPVDLVATLDTSFTVSGDEKTVNMAAHGGQQNFALTSYKNMVVNNLFGFPLTVESITPGVDNDHATVTGTIDLTKATSDFALLPGNKIVRVRNVSFKAITDLNGHRFGALVNTSVPIEGVSSLKFRYLNKYNVQVNLATAASAGSSNSSPYKTQTALVEQVNELMITKTDNNKGVIKGNIHIVDNSFNYPSTYLSFNDGANDLYLADASSGKLTTSLAAVTASFTENDETFYTKANYSPAQLMTMQGVTTNRKFNLTNASGDSVQLKFINFASTADPMNSYIQNDGKINLAINMKCHIANATPENISVKVSNIILDDDGINVTKGQQPILIKLEKWNLLIKDWALSPVDGGISSTNGLVQTGAIDIPFSQFNLRSDMFVIGNFALGNLQLGGGMKALTQVNVKNAALEYDQSVGSDKGPHWKFAIAGTGSTTPAAMIENLPSLNGPVGLSYIQMISNGESILTLQETSSPLIINNNSLAQFSPQGIVSGPGFFDIVGALNVNAPRMSAMGLSMHYVMTNGNLTATYKSVTQDFEGKGYVHFTASDVANNMSITKDSLVIQGSVIEQPSKTFNKIPAIFVASPNSAQKYKVLLQTPFTEAIVDGKYDLNISSGGMKVTNNDWDILSFTGVLVDNGKTNQSQLGDNQLTFNVLGDVQVDGSKLSTSENIAGFGKFSMSFDFSKPALHGSININNQKIEGFTVGGFLEMEFDNKGFYIGGAATAGMPVPIPVVSELLNAQVKLGFLIGSYQLSPNDAIWGEVTQYQVVKNACWLSSLGNKINGAYYTFGAQLNFGKEINLGVADVFFKADVGTDISMGVDFNQGLLKPRFVGMYTIYGDAEAGLASYLTGTDIDFKVSVGAALLGVATVNIQDHKLSGVAIKGSLDVSGEIKIRQSLLIKTVTLLDVRENMMIHAGTDGKFGIAFSSGDPQQPCLSF